MHTNRVPIIQRVAQHVRDGEVLDVYKIVADISPSYPDLTEDRLEQIVSEEVVRAGGNAFWNRVVDE